jgi:hypothetical protein
MKNFVAALMILCSPHTSFAGETSSCVTPSYQGVKLLVTEGAYVEYEENIHALDTVKVETQSGQVTLICYLDGTVLIVATADAKIIITRPKIENN